MLNNGAQVRKQMLKAAVRLTTASTESSCPYCSLLQMQKQMHIEVIFVYTGS